MTKIPESFECPNCGTQLRGQYCGQCGQRANSRLISLWELLKDAFGDLIELDSRVWRTLGPLLLKPGLLSKDYLVGRRARYMPPFRTYLVLSILFFIVAFFEPSEKFSLLFEPVSETSPSEVVSSEEEKRAAREMPAGLADEGTVSEAVVDGVDSSGTSFVVDDSDQDPCDISADDLLHLPDWLSKRLTLERAQEICVRIERDGGQYFLGLLQDNIPVALIVLLPLMALALKILYPLSRRYFVEHLLFFVHFHAFFFLLLTLEIVFSRTMDLLPIPESIPILANVAASFYIPVYLYLAMRRVYGQRHLFTALKFVVLLVTYLFGASLTLLGAALFALLSV